MTHYNHLIQQGRQAATELRNTLGLPISSYLRTFMITDKAIRDRFIKCFTEVNTLHTQARIAEAIGCHTPYLTKLKKSPSPQIPVLLVAKFCSTYNYSPHFILLGKGDMRDGPTKEEKKDIYYLRLIEGLLSALIELKGSWSDATGELVGEAMKPKQ